jgi:hypothetical protein
MSCDKLRLRFDKLWKPSFDRCGDPRVQLLAAPLEQAFVGGVAHKRVFEHISSGRRQASPENELCGNQAIKRWSKFRLRRGDDRCEQLMIELAADASSDLGDLLHGSETVEPGHQRIVQRGRDRQRWKRSCEHVAIAGVAEDPRFKHGFRQLLGEERHTLGPRQDLAEDLGRKRFALRDPLDQHNHLRLRQAVQREQRDMRKAGPWW